jgi:hypothetical protein
MLPEDRRRNPASSGAGGCQSREVASRAGLPCSRIVSRVTYPGLRYVGRRSVRNQPRICRRSQCKQ